MCLPFIATHLFRLYLQKRDSINRASGAESPAKSSAMGSRSRIRHSSRAKMLFIRTGNIAQRRIVYDELASGVSTLHLERWRRILFSDYSNDCISDARADPPYNSAVNPVSYTKGLGFPRRSEASFTLKICGISTTRPHIHGNSS